jgi:hypothetical protein
MYILILRVDVVPDVGPDVGERGDLGNVGL